MDCVTFVVEFNKLIIDIDFLNAVNHDILGCSSSKGYQWLSNFTNVQHLYKLCQLRTSTSYISYRYLPDLSHKLAIYGSIATLTDFIGIVNTDCPVFVEVEFLWH